MPEQYEQFYDGRPQVFESHQVKMLPTEVAEHLRAYSIIPGTLRRFGGGLKAERAFALGPGWSLVRYNRFPGEGGMTNDRYVAEYAEAVPEPEWMHPCELTPGKELFDRGSVGNYTERPSADGRPTHIEMVRV
jgi:hypothetical protein